MNFEGDAFISYAHMDNVELLEGRKGWVANLHRALTIRLGQLLGEPPQIWRDPKLQGNDFFAETLVDQLQKVAALVSIVSPRYVRSDWARRELSEFWRAAEQQGGIKFNEKARIFKVLKTPVPLDSLPPELRVVLGYEFFKVDPESGRVRELDEAFGPDAQKEFWYKLDDLAQDICCLLEGMRDRTRPAVVPSAASSASGDCVFLAETSSDLREQRDSIKRDLQQLGCTVLPSNPLPSVISELKARISEDLARSRMSIHLVGKNYGMVPEDAYTSLVEIQYDLASARAEQGSYCRLVWIPPGLQVENEKQKIVLDYLRMDSPAWSGSDVLETSLEDLKTVYHDKLRQKPEPEPAAQAGDDGAIVQVYLIYDQRDAAEASPWADFLFKQGFEVIRPVFEGDEAELREYHEENLCACDAALILYGQGNECWLRRKMRELQKSPGLGRTKPKPPVAIALVAPLTAEKQSFQTREATVVPPVDGFSSDRLGPLVASLKGK